MTARSLMRAFMWSNLVRTFRRRYQIGDSGAGSFENINGQMGRPPSDDHRSFAPPLPADLIWKPRRITMFWLLRRRLESSGNHSARDERSSFCGTEPIAIQ